MQPGTTLCEGRYELLSLLGQGGMAEVWRGLDHRFEVERAIKVMLPGIRRSGAAQARFEREARLMARLEHPHVVPVHDVGTHDGRLYLVMSLLSGSLEDELQADGRLHPARAARMVSGVLDALVAAHEHGVVHRDIKPHNILVDDRDQPRLTDFGIASNAEEQGLTRTGAVMGTLAYMAPEQRASARRVDGRADLYAVGALLFALVTGEDPTELDHPEGRDQRLGMLPEVLVGFVERSCRRAPGQRFPTAAEAREALDAARQQMPDDVVVPVVAGARWRPTGATMDLDHLDAIEGDTGGTIDPPSAAEEATAVSASAPTLQATPAAAPTVGLADQDTVALPPELAESTTGSRRWMAWVAGLLAASALAGGAVMAGVQLAGVSAGPGAPAPAPPVRPRAAPPPPSAPTPPAPTPAAEPSPPVERPPPEPAPSLAVPVPSSEPEPEPEPEAGGAPAPPPPPPAAAPAPDGAPEPGPEPEPEAEAPPPSSAPPQPTPTTAVFVASVPAGAEVWIDDVAVGTTPWQGQRAAGRYRVQLRHAGTDAERVISVGDERVTWCWDFDADAVCPR